MKLWSAEKLLFKGSRKSLETWEVQSCPQLNLLQITFKKFWLIQPYYIVCYQTDNVLILVLMTKVVAVV